MERESNGGNPGPIEHSTPPSSKRKKKEKSLKNERGVEM
jgi:hypothetical protein